jgi:hypothetical protein
MGVHFNHKGSFKNTERFFNQYNSHRFDSILNEYGRKGVSALANATPVEAGLTASSWNYSIEHSKSSFSLYFTNSNTISGGTPLAILIQYGHATKNGGWVQGRDFINPPIIPILDELANELWREVTNG